MKNAWQAVAGAERQDLALAFEALTALIYEEYDDDRPLSEIAEIWGPMKAATPEHIAALRRVEFGYANSASASATSLHR